LILILELCQSIKKKVKKLVSKELKHLDLTIHRYQDLWNYSLNFKMLKYLLISKSSFILIFMDLDLRNSECVGRNGSQWIWVRISQKQNYTSFNKIEPVARHLDRSIVEKSFVAGSQHVFSGRCVESVAHENEKFPKAYSAARCVREWHVYNKRRPHSRPAFSARLNKFPCPCWISVLH